MFWRKSYFYGQLGDSFVRRDRNNLQNVNKRVISNSPNVLETNRIRIKSPQYEPDRSQ